MEENNSSKHPFPDSMVASFKEIMKGVGFNIDNVTSESISKVFDNDKLYDKMVELMNMRRSIIDTQMKAVNTMFLYHHFGGDMFVVNHKLLGKSIIVKIESYDLKKGKVVFHLDKNPNKRYTMSKSSFENIIVKRIKSIE